MVSCSDSRVDPSTIFAVEPSEIFMVRNVAALVPPCGPDEACSGTGAALEFGVVHLGVEHVVVLGHTHCGGIEALLRGTETAGGKADLIGSWLSCTRGVRDRVVKEFCRCASAAWLATGQRASAMRCPRYPHHITFEWAGGYRAQRIMEKLAGNARHDIASFRSLQQDRVSLFARALLPRLRRAAGRLEMGETGMRARALLDDWEGAMDPERPEPLIFHSWVWEFGRLVSADELGALQRQAWGRKGPFIQRVLEEREVWCDDQATAEVETCDDRLARAFATAVDRLVREHGDEPAEWRWGDEHMAVAEHRPFSRTPLAALYNLSGPAPGSMYTVNAFSFSPLDDDTPFASTHGPGFRAIYDLADLDRSLFIHSTGQSGNILSSHYGDFEKPWRAGEYITIPTRRAAYEENALGRLRLSPP